MNETLHPALASDVPWPTSDHRVRVPDTSMLPGTERVAPAGVGPLNPALQGAHAIIDRVADSAAPAAPPLGERVPVAGDALRATTDPLRDTRVEWVERVRGTVRGSPWAFVAAAAALGAVIARITR